MTRRLAALTAAAAIVAGSYLVNAEPVWVTTARAQTAQREATCPDIPHGCFPTARCGIQTCYCPKVCGDASARPVWVDAPSDCTCAA